MQSFINLYNVALPEHRDKYYWTVERKLDGNKMCYDSEAKMMVCARPILWATPSSGWTANIHANMKDTWRYVGSDGYIVWNGQIYFFV